MSILVIVYFLRGILTWVNVSKMKGLFLCITEFLNNTNPYGTYFGVSF